MTKLAGLLCALAVSAAAQTVTIQPSAASVTPGQTFTADIVASGVHDLYAYQFALTFPQGSLTLNSVAQGPFLQTGGTTFFIPATPDGARALTAATLIGPIAGISGSGTLATFSFTAIATGPVQLGLTNLTLLNSALTGIAATGTGADVGVQLAPGPQINVDQRVLNFTYETDLPPPPAQTLAVTSNGVASFSSITTGGWISVSPSAGNTPAKVAVSVKPSGFTAGHYSGFVVIGGEGVLVNLYVLDPPRLLPAPASLSFSYRSGDPVPTAQALYVNSTSRHIAVTATANQSWLAVSPPGVETWGEFQVSVKPAGLAPGVYTGGITLTSSDAGNSPLTVPVTMYVTAAQ